MKKGIVISVIAASVLALAGCKMGGSSDSNGASNGMQSGSQTTMQKPMNGNNGMSSQKSMPSKKQSSNNQYQ